MAGLFESARQALGLMVALPFALAGAAWTLFFTKTDFDQPAAIGSLSEGRGGRQQRYRHA